MAKAIIVYDTPYSPTDEQWVEWLAKPQWTAAEAAALSLNISPELTEITRHENSSDWAIAMVAEGATYSLADREMASWMGPQTRATPTFHLILTEKGHVAGISLENQLYSRGIDLTAKALVSIDANLKKPSQWDFSTKWTPSDCIAQMQYWEWNLPAAMIGPASQRTSPSEKPETLPNPQSVAESIGESPMPPVVEKAFKGVSRLLTKEDVKAASKAEFKAECSRLRSEDKWPAVMDILDLQLYYMFKDVGAISDRLKDGRIPQHNAYEPGEKCPGSARRWDYADILNHEAKLKANRQAALDARDKNL